MHMSFFDKLDESRFDKDVERVRKKLRILDIESLEKLDFLSTHYHASKDGFQTYVSGFTLILSFTGLLVATGLIHVTEKNLSNYLILLSLFVLISTIYLIISINKGERERLALKYIFYKHPLKNEDQFRLFIAESNHISNLFSAIPIFAVIGLAYIFLFFVCWK